jgi:hypothetical protein
MDIND